MTKRIKRWALYGGLFSTILFLSGCMRIDQETGEPAGFFSQLMYDYLVLPIEGLMDWMAGFLGNYGFAIIALTILVHLIILPLSLKQRRSMTEQQVQMSAIQPAIQEIQEEIKQTNDMQKKQYLQEEMMGIYQENDINVLGQLTGCLPLLIQMPIFIAVFQVLQNSQNIASETFFGISLGQSSIILGLLTGVVYYFQTKLMQQGMSEEVRKQSGMMSMITPIMLLFISITSPAGLALYFLTGGIFNTIQSLVINNYYKPKIDAELEEKYGEQKVVQRKPKPENFDQPRDVTESGNTRNRNAHVNQNNGHDNRRNAGKQRNNRNE